MPLDVATLDVLGVGGWVLEKHLNDVLYGHLGMDGTLTDKKCSYATSINFSNTDKNIINHKSKF